MVMINVRDLAAQTNQKFEPKAYEMGVDFLKRIHDENDAKFKKTNTEKYLKAAGRPFNPESNGMYIIVLKDGKNLTSHENLNGACHAGARSNSDTDLIATITHRYYPNSFVTGGPLKISAEARFAYYDWLLNRSIYKDFILKSPDENFASEYGIMISGDLHPAVALSVLVMSRHCGERGAQVQAWYELVKSGRFDENTAFAIALSSSLCLGGTNQLYQMISDHMIFGADFTFKGMAYWLRGDLNLNNPKASVRKGGYMNGVMTSTNGPTPHTGLHWVAEWQAQYKRRSESSSKASTVPNPFVRNEYGSGRRTVDEFNSKLGQQIFRELLNNEIAKIVEAPKEMKKRKAA